MCPQNKKRGRVAHVSKPTSEWDPRHWQTLSSRGWTNGGSRGAKPPWRGAWGASPHKFKRGGDLPPLATRPRVGPKTLVNPKPTGVGKWGQGGEAPMAGGVPRSRRLKSASLKKGRPAPSTGVASLRPYIEPGVEGAQPPPREC